MSHSLSLPALAALEAVLAADRTGSFSRAADELDLTHGAVSRRIASVEAWAGIPLFERLGRGVRLTVEGQRFVRVISQALDLIGSSAAEWREPERRETVKVSVLPSFARLWLLPNLSRLEGSSPEIRVEMTIEHRFAQPGEIDVAIRYGRGDWRTGTAVPLFAETLVPVASPELAAVVGSEPLPGNLLDYCLIHDRYPDSWRIWFNEHAFRYRPRPQDRSFLDYDLGLLAAISGCGIALLRKPYGANQLRDGRLIALYNRSVPSPMGFYAVCDAGPKRQAVGIFLERLAAISKSTPPA